VNIKNQKNTTNYYDIIYYKTINGMGMEIVGRTFKHGQKSYEAQ